MFRKLQLHTVMMAAALMFNFAAADQPQGSLQVTIEPQEAVTGGAQWRINGGGWQNSGTVVSGLLWGEYSLEFSDSYSGHKPPNQTVIIDTDSKYLTGVYYSYVQFTDPHFKAAVESALATADPSTNEMLLLTSLDVLNSSIQEISGIGYALNLTRLRLSGCQLTGLPPEIGNLAKLTSLDLENNQLASTPPEIGNLANLNDLTLSGNQLTVIPPEIGNLAKLTVLYLNDNQLTAVPPEIGSLANLNDLSLSGNRMTNLPPQIGSLTNLVQLRLYNNQLTAIPPQIGSLAKLVLLRLYDNQLTSLPPEIGSLTNLTELGLYNNQLTAVPPQIGNLMNLTWLDLGFNQLTSIPPQVGSLTNLTVLYLDNNRLISLPPEITSLGSVSLLYLTGNPWNTNFYCDILPGIIANNPLDWEFEYDPNPNPISNDCSTNLFDLALFTEHWLENNCHEFNNWCTGADLNHVNDVDMEDMAQFAYYWLK